MDSVAPGFDIARKTALQENSKALSIAIPSAIATTNAPVNESLAP